MSDSKALTVAGTAVRQMNGLYSLNDLHKASGGEAKHEPNQFSRLDQTQALIAEIKSADMRNCIETRRGKNGGTYACKELVIAYAAWISAAFHLKVIRVFLSVAAPQSAPYRVQPGQTLSGEQAATLRNMLHDGVKKLPKAEQGNAMLVGWSKLKAHFNVGYRQIPAAEFHEALSILARHLAAWQVHSFEPTPRLRDLERANKGLQRMVEQLHSALGQALSVGRSLQSAASHFIAGKWSEGVQDKSGIVIKDDVDFAGQLGQFMGFSPSEVRLAYEGKAAIHKQDRALGARRSTLMEQFALAAMAGDEEGKAEAREAITRFNEKNPSRAIKPMNLAQSVRMRQRRIDQAQDGVYLPRNRRDAVEAGRFAATAYDED